MKLGKSSQAQDLDRPLLHTGSAWDDLPKSTCVTEHWSGRVRIPLCLDSTHGTQSCLGPMVSGIPYVMDLGRNAYPAISQPYVHSTIQTALSL